MVEVPRLRGFVWVTTDYVREWLSWRSAPQTQPGRKRRASEGGPER